MMAVVSTTLSVIGNATGGSLLESSFNFTHNSLNVSTHYRNVTLPRNVSSSDPKINMLDTPQVVNKNEFKLTTTSPVLIPSVLMTLLSVTFIHHPTTTMIPTVITKESALATAFKITVPPKFSEEIAVNRPRIFIIIFYGSPQISWTWRNNTNASIRGYHYKSGVNTLCHRRRCSPFAGLGTEAS